MYNLYSYNFGSRLIIGSLFYLPTLYFLSYNNPLAALTALLGACIERKYFFSKDSSSSKLPDYIEDGFYFVFRNSAKEESTDIALNFSLSIIMGLATSSIVFGIDFLVPTISFFVGMLSSCVGELSLLVFK